MNIEPQAQPIPKELHEKLKSHGIEEIIVQCHGGSDEGYVYTNVKPSDEHISEIVDEWAQESFMFNGAGDGTEYGTDFVYDLKKNTVIYQEWSMAKTTECEEERKIETK